MSIAMLLFISVCVGTLGPFPFGITVGTGLTFNRQHYVFIFYDILHKDYTFDSNNFTEKIIVRDVVGPANFAMRRTRYLAIEPVASNNNGEAYARLKVLTTIKAPYKSFFPIVAWDAKHRVASATMKVEVVETYFATFLKPVYHGEVTEDLKVIIYDGTIVLNGGDEKDYVVVVSKKYKDFFSVQFSFEDVELYIRAEQTLQSLPEFPINLTLTAYDRYLNNTAETTVVLNGPLLQKPRRRKSTKHQQEY